MNHLTHSIGGAVLWAGGCWVAAAPAGVLLAGAAVAAVTAPWNDIDNLGAWRRASKRGLTRRRRGRRTTYRVHLIRWRRHPVKSRLSWLVCRFGNHREGPCHSLITAAVAGLLLALMPWWPWWAGAAVGAGLASHILLDLLNERPVRALWPLPWMGALDLMRVGKAGERWVARPALVAALMGLGWLTAHGYR